MYALRSMISPEAFLLDFLITLRLWHPATLQACVLATRSPSTDALEAVSPPCIQLIIGTARRALGAAHADASPPELQRSPRKAVPARESLHAAVASTFSTFARRVGLAVQSGGYVLSDRTELTERLREMGSTWWEGHAEKMLLEQPRMYNSLTLKHKKTGGGTDADKEAFIFYCLGLGFPGAFRVTPHAVFLVLRSSSQALASEFRCSIVRVGTYCMKLADGCHNAGTGIADFGRRQRNCQSDVAVGNRVERAAGEGLALMLPEKTITIVDEGAEVVRIEKFFPNELVFDKWFERSGYSDLVEEDSNKAHHLYAFLEDGGTYYAMSNSRVRMQNITSSRNSARRGRSNEEDHADGGSDANGRHAQDESGEQGDPPEASAVPALAAVTASAAAEWDRLAKKGAALLARLWATITSVAAALARFWAHVVGALVETAAPQPQTQAQRQPAQTREVATNAAPAARVRAPCRWQQAAAPVFVGCRLARGLGASAGGGRVQGCVGLRRQASRVNRSGTRLIGMHGSMCARQPCTFV